MKISMRLQKLVAPVLVLATAIFGLSVAAAAPASSDSGAKRTVIVHFQRADNNYGAADSSSRWDVYYWRNAGATGDGSADFIGEDSFGKYAVLTFTEDALTQIGVIVRHHVWDGNQSQNIMVDLPEKGATHIWVRANDDIDSSMDASGPATVFNYNPDRKVIIHYARPANDWELAGHEGDPTWSWAVFTGEGDSWANTHFTEFENSDEWGKVAVVTVTDTSIATFHAIISANHWNAGHVQSQNMDVNLNMTGDTHLWIWETDVEGTDNREHSVATTNPFRLVTVHFNRVDGQYGDPGSPSRWDTYYWKMAGENFKGDGSVEFASDAGTDEAKNDNFGRVARIVVTDPEVTQLGIIPRHHSWDGTQTQNIMVTLPPSGEKEVWVKANDDIGPTTNTGPATISDTDPRGRQVTVHFWRKDGNYEPFDMWFWGDDGGSGPVNAPGTFNRIDKDGAAFFRFYVDDANTTKIGIIIRHGKCWDGPTCYKDAQNENRYITLNREGATEVWLKESDPMVYTVNPLSDDPTVQSIKLSMNGLQAGSAVKLPAKTNRGGYVHWVSMTPDTCRVTHGTTLTLGRPGACRIIGSADPTEIARAATFKRTVTIK